jgi:hypothetical protein
MRQGRSQPTKHCVYRIVYRMSNDLDSLSSEYNSKLQSAMVTFQFIEESLRMYIDLSFWIIIKKIDNIIPFNFSYKDVQKDSLGTLLDKFKKFN